eukprot:GHVT01002136.1.p2 GENE.GHVT01002136.1~~GHVT01002136.1.p2  ORF type:complete len:227 (-),score=54.18 GHVT01002136.1:733-1413(-)
MEGDELSPLREQFYAGYLDTFLQLAVASAPPVSADARAEKECLVARAQLALGRLTPADLDCSRTTSSPGLMAVKLTKEFFDSTCEKERWDILRSLKNVETPVTRSLIAACCSATDDYTRGFELVEEGPLEVKAAKVQLMLLAHRTDIAEKTYYEMQDINDEDAITKVAGLLVSCATGPKEEAYLICNDLQRICCRGEDGEGRGSATVLIGSKRQSRLQGRPAGGRP